MDDIGTVSFPSAKPHAWQYGPQPVADADARTPGDDDIKKVDIGQGLTSFTAIAPSALRCIHSQARLTWGFRRMDRWQAQRSVRRRRDRHDDGELIGRQQSPLERAMTKQR
jgi:hypothetical protein